MEIQSLRIEQIEFADKTMQKQVSEFAMTNTKLQSQQQTIRYERWINDNNNDQHYDDNITLIPLSQPL